MFTVHALNDWDSDPQSHINQIIEIKVPAVLTMLFFYDSFKSYYTWKKEILFLKYIHVLKNLIISSNIRIYLVYLI